MSDAQAYAKASDVIVHCMDGAFGAAKLSSIPKRIHSAESLPAGTPEVVINGGFEVRKPDGQLGVGSPWAVSDQTNMFLGGAAACYLGTNIPGYYAAVFNPPSPSTMSQTIQTIAGRCTLSFIASVLTAAGSPQFLNAAIDGTVLVDASTPPSSPQFQTYSAVFAGTGGQQQLVFNVQNPITYYLVDNVSVRCG